jgi:hypothetical protein
MKSRWRLAISYWLNAKAVGHWPLAVGPIQNTNSGFAFVNVGNKKPFLPVRMKWLCIYPKANS